MRQPARLRIALLAYRGNPRVGGQGVYCRFLSRELGRLGHEVTVFSGQPWPVLDEGVRLVKVPSLDLYREPDPFRVPRLAELRSWVDVAEVLTMFAGGFPEPRTFSWRARRLLSHTVGPDGRDPDGRGSAGRSTAGRSTAGRSTAGRSTFDVVHDNGSFPMTVDRLVDLAVAEARWKEVSMKRWYGFLRMQNAVARRLPRVLTVSWSSRRDIIEQMGLAPERVGVVPIGTDPGLFRPLAGRQRRRVPGRVMTTASADVPMKGLVYLLEALAKLRTEQPFAHLLVVGEPRPAKLRTEQPFAHLLVVGEPRPASEAAISRFGLEGAVFFRSGVGDSELVELYSEASVAAVPSLYEGFSLPAVEAMACEVPLVVSAGGALPEVVGPHGEAALLVPPADPGALASALGSVLGDATFGERLGRRGRRRALARFTWERCAAGTVDHYRSVLDGRPSRPC